MWHLKPDWNCWAKVCDKIGRFDADVPVETVILPNPEAGREKVGEHVVHKPAQTPASHRIIRCETPVRKRQGTNTYASPPALPAVREGNCANVSLPSIGFESSRRVRMEPGIPLRTGCVLPLGPTSRRPFLQVHSQQGHTAPQIIQQFHDLATSGLTPFQLRCEPCRTDRAQGRKADRLDVAWSNATDAIS